MCNNKQFWIDKKLPYKIDHFIRGDTPNYISPNKPYIIFDDNTILKHYYNMYYVVKTLDHTVTINKDIIQTLINLLRKNNKYTIVYKNVNYDFYHLKDLDLFLDNPIINQKSQTTKILILIVIMTILAMMMMMILLVMILLVIVI